MTYEELRHKFEDFRRRFFAAGKLKKQLQTIDTCLKEMEDQFTFEITIYPYRGDLDIAPAAVTFEIEIPEKALCEPLRGLIGQFKLIHIKKLDQLGVKG